MLVTRMSVQYSPSLVPVLHDALAVPYNALRNAIFDKTVESPEQTIEMRNSVSTLI